MKRHTTAYRLTIRTPDMNEFCEDRDIALDEVEPSYLNRTALAEGDVRVTEIVDYIPRHGARTTRI